MVGVYAEELATELPRAYVVPKGGLDSIKSKPRGTNSRLTSSSG